jgi:two-component system cell cycle sensor histidine kinase/response regulator CckA
MGPQGVFALADPARRAAHARDLARALGAEDLVVLVHDPSVDAILPGPGFLRTLPGAGRWRALIAAAIGDRGGPHRGLVGRDGEVAALARAADESTVLVLLGGSPASDALDPLLAATPLLGCLLARERELETAHWDVANAARSLQETRALAAALDSARDRAERTLRELEASEGQRRQSAERLREASEQLEQARKMDAIGRLAGGVAHDFNNLLTIIQNYTELARRSAPDGTPAHRHLGQVLAATDRATRLTRQLLAMSRRQVVRDELVDLRRLVVDMAALAQGLLGEGVQTELDLAPDTPAIRLDPYELDQVLVNLMVNARDAMPGGGTVTIRSRRVHLATTTLVSGTQLAEGDYATVSVQDTGVGIQQEVLAHLFEPFYTTKPQGVGTGLGLSLAYAVVHRAGGAIAVRSSPGQGAEFVLYVPEAAAPPVDDVPVTPSQLPAGLTVLVVEDEPSLRELVRDVLGERGFCVLDAGDGAAALRRAEGRHVDVLLTDLRMPGMSGRELAERMLGGRPHLSVLFMSGYSGDTGPLPPDAAFLAKPFTDAQLLAAIGKLLLCTAA